VELLPGDFKVTWHFEERSAAFFALGRTKATGKPVGVVTTSGTAAGEMLPAAMEAHFSGLPLVLITADRPRRFRGSGAPQAAYQRGLFGVYAPTAYDLGEEPARIPISINARGPTHINVCFEDPTVSEHPVAECASNSLANCKNPFAIVGALKPQERRIVLQYLLSFPGAIYCEALSGLREAPELQGRLARVADGLFRRADPPFDGVLRLGGVPTHRLWRDLEDKYAHLPVVSMSSLPFSGLGRESTLLPLPAEGSLASVEGGNLLPENHTCTAPGLAGIEGLLAKHPCSEPGMVRRLTERIDQGSRVFLGNSLPIREWDLAATYEPRGFEMSASRGLNGIDGQVSTFLGSCTADRPNWALFGDLTTLYDLAGPWPIAQLDPAIGATIVILNNGGGRIFDRMFQAPEFQNQHTRTFESWANLWGLQYLQTSDPASIPPHERGVRIVELVPDADATKAFWLEFDEAFK
jgi:2-succinyl-5-enolpyruvyl-6-hydroxy-3-cyclohexene-1-carboxylate synthase